MLQNKVSICVPVYNDSRYLALSLQSLLNQTYRNLEIIVVDDGSEDKKHVSETCHSMKDSRISYYRQSNQGVSSALNYALEKATGKYFCWLSHDDVYDERKIEMQLRVLDNLDDKYKASYTAYKLIDGNSQVLAEVSLKDQLKKTKTKLGPIEFGMLHGCSIMMNLEFMREVGHFSPSLKYVQDYDYWIRCVKQGAKFEYLDEPLVLGRVHNDQVGKMSDTTKENIHLWERIASEWFIEIMKEKAGSTKIIVENIKEYLEFFQTQDSSENAVFFTKAKKLLEDLLIGYNYSKTSNINVLKTNFKNFWLGKFKRRIKRFTANEI